LGAGAQALESTGYAKELGWEIAFYFVEPGFCPEEPLDAPCITREDDLTPFQNFPLISAVGSPRLRQSLVSEWPNAEFVGVSEPFSWIAPDVRLGCGVTISPGVMLNRKVQIGDHTLINQGSAISHDSTIGRFVTVGPGCTIAGRVQIGDGVSLSLGSVVGPGVCISAGAVVGAGAVVLSDVESAVLVVGTPAKPIRTLPDWE